MRRLARNLFTLCSAISLVLCVAAYRLAGRSWAQMDVVTWVEEQGDVPRPHHAVFAASDRGVLWLSVTRYDEAAVVAWPEPPGFEYEVRPAWRRSPSPRPAGGFGVRFVVYRRADRVARGVNVTHRAFVLATGAAPGAWLAAQLLRRSRRIRPGCCASCGYDLRATPGRCPECGAGTSLGAEVQE